MTQITTPANQYEIYGNGFDFDTSYGSTGSTSVTGTSNTTTTSGTTSTSGSKSNSYMGLRQATRTAVHTAFVQGLSAEFWQPFDPKQVVVLRYPIQAVAYSIVHLDVTFGPTRWAELTAAPQNWSSTTEERLLTGDATIGVKIYARSAIQRDRWADALETLVACSDMLDASAFRAALTTDKVCVQPIAASIQNQGDVESQDIPWMGKDLCFMTGFSFDTKITYLFDLQQATALVKHIQTDATLGAADA